LNNQNLEKVRVKGESGAPRLDKNVGTLHDLRILLASCMRTTAIPRILYAAVPNAIAFTTVGDLVLLVPLLVASFRGIHSTFVNPDVSVSGAMATYAMYYAFVTASKSNSPFSFFFEIPYERLIGLHWASGLAAVALGFCHGYVAYRHAVDKNRIDLHGNNDAFPSED